MMSQKKDCLRISGSFLSQADFFLEAVLHSYSLNGVREKPDKVCLVFSFFLFGSLVVSFEARFHSELYFFAIPFIPPLFPYFNFNLTSIGSPDFTADE